MVIETLKKIQTATDDNNLAKINLFADKEILVYPKSINEFKEQMFFIGRTGAEKYLFIASSHLTSLIEKLTGNLILKDYEFLKQCNLSNSNAEVIQSIFPFTKPVPLGNLNSFGFGDRLGLANPAHIRSLNGFDFKPVLAQQSIRELERTNRKPADVMSAAVWAVFQEGYKNGFGADADHLKTTEDIDLMIKAGFTMFTFDPSEFVINRADNLSVDELEKHLGKINWDDLNSTFEELIKKYESQNILFDKDFVITPSRKDILKAIIKYGNAIAHIKYLYNYLKKNYPDIQTEVEISVDETDAVTTPFEHFFIASELNRLDIKFISLAPRFIGDFEKGIDYKGDLEIFKSEYLKHIQIAEQLGNYKISLHSGSDKFGVYKTIGSLQKGNVHVKTAGTSYLEAVKVIALKQPGVFRKILNFCKGEYEKEKRTYHVSADIEKILDADKYSNKELIELFNIDDVRQVLHVTYGRVLTEKDENGNFIFRNVIYKCLNENEQIHYDFLIKHFRNHLEPFTLNLN